MVEAGRNTRVLSTSSGKIPGDEGQVCKTYLEREGVSVYNNR